MSAEDEAVLLECAKRWVADETHVLHVMHNVVAKAVRVYSGEDGDRFNDVPTSVLEFDDGNRFVFDTATAGLFVPLTRELVEFYRSIQDGFANLVKLSARVMASRNVVPEVGIKLLECAMQGQLRAMRAK